MSAFVLPLSDPQAVLEVVGGKGASLARLTRAGLPVPGGFHITTAAYRQFVAENGLQPKILAALQALNPADPASLEAVSGQIGQYFKEGRLPAEISAAITAAYAGLQPAAGGGAGLAVAVRSSATAEDLPEASFAGQQETYLNIRGAQAVLAAVQQCWASLWTGRAIAYRARQGIGPDAVALAVVVQELVFAEAAGILFTANPLSGRRDEMMITAAWGLGEAIVGGLVTPDTLVASRAGGKVRQRKTSRKEVMTVRTETGTRQAPVPAQLQNRPVLTRAQAAELVRLGAEIEGLYGLPVDIEWTLAAGQFVIVQARPITSLPDAPLEWIRSNPKALLARGSFAEFVPDPVSPLFATLAVPIAERETQKLFSDVLKSEKDVKYLIEVLNGYVYIGMELTARMVWTMTVVSIAQTKELFRTVSTRWEAARAATRRAAEKWSGDLSTWTAPDLLSGAREIFTATAAYYTVAQSGPIPVASFSELLFSKFYTALVKGKPDPLPSTFFLGFETLPLRAEKSLYDLSIWAGGQPGLAEYLSQAPAAEIGAAFRSGRAPAALFEEFAARFAAHLAEFGHALYDLDFARPLPADQPELVLDTLKLYLSGQGANPHLRQQAQAERRQQAAETIARRLDPLRRRYFTRLLKWAQASSPGREDCIADLGLGYPQLRRLLGELGRRLAEGGAIAGAGDVYWLENQELEALCAALQAGTRLASHAEEVELRKARWQRARRASPPFSLPEKNIFSKLLVHDNPEGSTLKGYAASPGRVTAPACVLLGPEDFGKMRPGDVIVAVTTTPAWTPLFALASAVVTDIGGPLSHSSIVAREYGIPAIMATGVASRRIQHHQVITVDGSAGIVTLLEVEPAA